MEKNIKRLSIDIDTGLGTKLKLLAVKSNTSQKELVLKLIKDYVKSQ